MSNKTQKKSSNIPSAKAEKKKINFLPFLAVAAVIICVVVVFAVKSNGNSSVSESTVPKNNGTVTSVSENTVSKNSEAVTIASGESLVIPTADITTKASFYLVTVDGTDMEVIAVRDSKGDIRTAFNTCQVCYDSGKGYYIQSGDYLVCQNCGNRFSMDQVGIESGGCNPWPIFDEDRTVTADEVSISYDFLAESRDIFAKWKGNY